MSIVHALEEVARRVPASPSLLWRGCVWTYADLAASVTAMRSAIAARNLEPRSRVALLLRNSPQYVALYYGTLAAGCIAVPLNAHERAGVLARQIEHSGSRLLAGDPEHPEWPSLCEAVRRLDLEILPTALADGPGSAAAFAQSLGAPAGAESAAALGDSDPAAIIYTSGTTGRPKGVLLSHGNLHSNARSIIEYLGLDGADRGFCVLPFHFSYGNSVLHSHLLAAAELVLEDNFAYPQVALKRMQDEAVTGFAGVPSTFALLLRCRIEDFDLGRLRYVTQAGGPMPRPLLERLRAQLPATKIFVMYGQTEATARLTYLPPERLDEKLGSAGIPIPGVEIEVRGNDGAVAAGTVGEICARGPNVMLGYWNDPEATAAVLRDGWLRTGDLGHLDDDGFLYIAGRAVDMIKVGAFRVSPQEVEEVVAGLDDVVEVGVTGIPDDVLGQAIKAVVVPRAGSDLSVMAVKAHCRKQLAAYKVPKVVELTSALPKTSSGKVQRFHLASERFSNDSR